MGERTGRRLIIYGMNYAPEMIGVGKYTGELAEYLCGQGVGVEVVTAQPHYPGWRILPGAKNSWSSGLENGVRVFRCPLLLAGKMEGVARFLAPLSFAITSSLIAIERVIAARQGVILCVEPTLLVAPLALLLGKLKGWRCILHVQDLEIDAAFAVGHLRRGGLAARLSAVFESWCLASFDSVVTISETMAEALAGKGVARSKLHVLRNWVDLEAINPSIQGDALRSELGIGPDRFVALYSGNLGRKQGIQTLIEAARLVSEPEILIVIAGDGPEAPSVQRAALESENVMIVPLQPAERFAEFVRMADLHLLPQTREVADLVLPSKLGAMLASGRPVLLSADRDTELFNFVSSCVTVAPPDDAAAFAEAIMNAHAELESETAVAARLELASELSRTKLLPIFRDIILDG